MLNKALKLGVAGFLAVIFVSGASAREQSQSGFADANTLPSEARATLTLIKRGGPFPYAKDGAVFGNYEQQLPRQPRGYYHEYTVPTPHARSRGARRIIVGGTPSSHADYFYTGDHYASFQRIKEE